MVTVRVCSKLKTSLKSAKRLKMLADGMLPKHVGEMTGHQCSPFPVSSEHKPCRPGSKWVKDLNTVTLIQCKTKIGPK